MNLGQNLLLWLRGTLPYFVSRPLRCSGNPWARRATVKGDRRAGKGTGKGEAIMKSCSRDFGFSLNWWQLPLKSWSVYSNRQSVTTLIVMHNLRTRYETFKKVQPSWLCSLLQEIRLLCLIWKLSISPFTWCMAAWPAAKSCRVTDQNKEGCW